MPPRTGSSELDNHIVLCNERYKHMIEKLDHIDKRLDKFNGRWWAVICSTIGVLGLGCVSMIVYIWVNRL